MDRIEIQQTGGFPLESDTLTFLQNAFDSFNKLGYFSGNSVIVQGCHESDGNVSNGWVFVNGELMPFEGGAIGDFVRIITTTEERIFENGESKAVYHRKKAMFGSPGIPWQVFQRPKSLYELTLADVALQKKTVPVGAIMMWAGAVNEIPEGWKLCDGDNGTPDLRSKFIVGYNANENDYNEIGKTGGEKSVTLTEAQMPKHKHNVSATHSVNHSHSVTIIHPYTGTPIGGGFKGGDNDFRSKSENTGTSPGGTITVSESEKGSNTAHENRPPYYTIAFIQFKNT